MSSSSDTIKSIQLLRAVAASMVLLYHVGSAVNGSGGHFSVLAVGGAGGVDLFFVISGLVIYLVTRKAERSPRRFLVRRIIRVGPPYWLYSCVAVALLFVPGAFRQLRFDLGFVVQSFLFILSNNSAGLPGTVLGVGWTLAFEMYFYVMFALALAILPSRALLVLSVALVSGAVASLFVHEVPVQVRVVFSALPLEFLGGSGLGMLYERRRFLSVFESLMVLALGLGCIGYATETGALAHPALGNMRVIWFGLPALGIVYSALSLEAHGTLRVPSAALFVGDASYSLYLCHQFVIALAERFWKREELFVLLPDGCFVATAVVMALGIAAVSYRYFEKPVTSWLRRWVVAHSFRAREAELVS